MSKGQIQPMISRHPVCVCVWKEVRKDTAKIGCTDVMAWHIHKWVRKRLAFKHKRGRVRLAPHYSTFM